MSKPFNQLLHNDIKLLKSIDRKKFPEEYRRVFGNIMKRHSISRTTVYTELAKNVPGTYDKYESKSRYIMINNKETAMVKDLLTAGKSTRNISKTMSLELGFRYTPYRIYKVKELLRSGKTISGITPILEEAAGDESARLLDESTRIKPLSQDETVVFKGNISRFFNRLSMINFIDPKRPLKIKLQSNIYRSSSRVIKDCFSHIIYSASGEGKSLPELFRFDMETILINEFENIKRGNKVSPAALRQLESIRRSLLVVEYENVKGSPKNGGYCLDDIYRIVLHFAPNITREEVAKYIAGDENP